jgi:hypothetical protein
VEELCLCSKRLLNVEHAPWVFRGRPCCSCDCYRKAAAADTHMMALRTPTPRLEGD